MKYKLSIFNLIVFCKGIVLIKNYLTGATVSLESGSFGLLVGAIKKKITPPAWSKKISGTNGILVRDSKNELIFFEKLIDHSYDESSKKLSIYFLPTLLCQFDCYYCFEIGKNKITNVMNNDIETKFVKWLGKYLEDNKEIEEVRIIFFGGEPLLRKDIIERVLKSSQDIISIKNIKLSTELITNGELIDDNIMDILSRHNLKRLQITLDGFRKYHDSVRFSKKGGSFDKIIANLIKVSQCEYLPVIDVRISLFKDSYRSVKKLLLYLKNLGFAHKVSITFGIIEDYSGGCATCTEQEISTGTARRYLALMILAKEMGFEIQSEFSAGPICFAKMKHSVVIKPDGGMQKCFCSVALGSYDFGNIKDDTHSSELFDSRYSIENNRIQKCIEEGCPFIPICNGGCTWRSLFKDPQNGHITRTCNKGAMYIINRGLLKAGIY